MDDSPTDRERVAGSILGLAIGDSLGYPHEFRSVAAVRRDLGPRGITDFVSITDPRFRRPPCILARTVAPGTFTDDTQMTWCVAEALLEAGAGSDEDLVAAMARRFVAWYFSADNDRSPGETTGIACERLRAGVSPRESGVVESKGCGANMRVAPIGLYYEDLDRVAAVARRSAALTHAHPAAQEGAAAAALLVALARRGEAPEVMFEEVMRRCGGRADEFDEVFGRVPELLRRAPEEVLVDRRTHPEALGEGWVADEAVASAMYSVWRHPDDFRAGVLEAVNTDGDSDSLATITGSILGARLGLGGIPAQWVVGVERAGELLDLGLRLASARASAITPEAPGE